MMNKERTMTQKDEEWENYLLSIGVVNLNDDAEISRKLATSKDEQIDNEPFSVLREKVERDSPEYQSALRDAIEEITTDTGKPIELLSREDIVNWLLSLGD